VIGQWPGRGHWDKLSGVRHGRPDGRVLLCWAMREMCARPCPTGGPDGRRSLAADQVGDSADFDSEVDSICRLRVGMSGVNSGLRTAKIKYVDGTSTARDEGRLCVKGALASDYNHHPHG